MSRVISRNHNRILWQCINWELLIKYIVSLKSRLYKAFLDKSKKKVYQLQSILINSQIFIIVAFKNSVNCYHFKNNSFEVGYVVFCLYHAIDIDYHFFDCYRQTSVLNFYLIIKDLVDQIKYAIFSSLLEPYNNYLFYINNLYYSYFYKLDSLYYVSCQKYNLSGYAMYINLRSYINCIDLSTFINKLDLIRVVKVYCFKFLDAGVFSTLLLYLDSVVDYKAVRKKKNTLFIQLLNIFILQICYEMIFMFINSFNYSVYSIKKIILINNLFDLLVISREPYNLRVWRNILGNLVFCNGSNVENSQEFFSISLLQGIDYNHVFITSNQSCYPFYYLIRPSLYNQFNLIQQISVILMQFKSQPLFLLVIRSNMLLLLWSYYYVNQPVKKMFYLVDYLINLKFRLYLKKAINKYFLKIKLYSHHPIFGFNFLLKDIDNSIIVIVKNSKLYRYYFLVKLSWLYKLKCQINLREAI